MTAPGLSVACPQCGAKSLKAVTLPRSSIDEALAREYFAASGQSVAQDVVTQGVCSRCGCRWIPRTSQERRLRALSGQLGREAQLAAEVVEAARPPAGAGNIGRKSRPLVWILVVAIVAELIVALLT